MNSVLWTLHFSQENNHTLYEKLCWLPLKATNLSGCKFFHGVASTAKGNAEFIYKTSQLSKAQPGFKTSNNLEYLCNCAANGVSLRYLPQDDSLPLTPTLNITKSRGLNYLYFKRRKEDLGNKSCYQAAARH